MISYTYPMMQVFSTNGRQVKLKDLISYDRGIYMIIVKYHFNNRVLATLIGRKS